MDKNDQRRVSHWDFIVAAVLLTRLPLPTVPQSAFECQARSVWAFPLIGGVLGILSCGVGVLVMAFGLGAGIAAGLMIATTILATGAMHFDGLADCADGFWGDFAPKRRLEIMKDSQIGTYGVIGLILVIGLQWVALGTLVGVGWGAVIAAAALSRAMMPIAMNTLPHARDTGLAHGVGKPAARWVQISVLIGVLIAILCVGWAALVAVLVALAVAATVRLIAKAKIGGQTGDVLGATQVLCETAVLLVLIII